MAVFGQSRERNRPCPPPPRRSRGRIANLPLHQFEREESRLAIRGNPQNPICKEIALQRSKTSKFDYFSTPNQPARSRDSEFFTDDNIYDATLKIIAVAKVKANIVIHICSSIAWQAGARPVSQPPAPGLSSSRWTGPQPMIRATCA